MALGSLIRSTEGHPHGRLQALVQGFYDALAAGRDVDAAIDRYLPEDFVEHEALPGMGTTREAPRQVLKMAQVAIPDFSITAHEMLQDGDKVAMRAPFSGTHQGEFMGFPASGKRVDIAVIDIYQVRDDKIVAHWGLTNMADVMAPAEAAAS